MKTFEEITAIVANEIDKFNWDKNPKGLYQPIGYALSLGGKRVRPALCLMACNIFSNNIDAAITPALGIEVFHNFTLLHDDIMDRADIRRGQATVHIKWDENTAILSGDAMQIFAYQLMAKTPAQNLQAVLDLFSTTAIEICEGQQYDVEFENRNNVIADEYLEMIRLKTAVLLACSLKTGAIIGGAAAKDAELLYDFGINIGLAFQLKDDLLDVYGDEATFGKKIGGDILCNKKTYLLIHAKKLAANEMADELNHWLACTDKNEAKIEGVRNIYNQLGVQTICEDKMDDYYKKAIAKIDEMSVDLNKTQELRKLAAKLMGRKD